ncbi:MAG TPA: DUF1761 domain-containing protein [Bauldia sp.]|nr:DUF1761 domain-containing protein [Bauldia sp.]
MEISWLAVIVAAAAKFLIGWGWYSNAAFGPKWRQLNNASEADVQANIGPALVVEAITDLVMAYVLARFVAHYGYGFGIGVLVAFMAWLGFVATVLAGQVFYELRPRLIPVINGGYFLVSMVIMGAILGVWH